MAKYRIVAEITVEGASIKNYGDAVDELGVLLGCYDDMSDTETVISILPLKTDKI